MKMKNLILLVFIFLLGEAKGQEVVSLSLSDAIESGLANNFDIIIEDTRAVIGTNNNTWGNAGRYPTVSLQLGSNNRLSNVDNPASFINGQYSNLGATGTLNLAWTLFNGFSVRINKSRLVMLEELSQGNAAVVIENSLQAIILQYYFCLLQKQQLNVLKENLSLSRDKMKFAELKRELGSGSTFDVLTIQNSYLSDSSAFILQQLNLDNSLRNLSELLGFEPGTKVDVTDRLSTNLSRYKLEDLSEKMKANNQTLKNQYLNLEIIQKDVELAQANRYPVVTLNSGSTYSTNRFALEGYDPRTGSQLDYYANFSLNFTLYDGGRVRRNIENAQINTRISELTTEKLERSMDFQLLSAFENYKVRLSLLSLAEESWEIAKKNEEIASEKFRNSTINSFNYRDIQLALLRAALARAQAVYDLLDAETALLRITGGILDISSN